MNEEYKLLSELKNIGERYNVRIRVDSINASVSKTERQEGVLSDETGKMIFVVWYDSEKRYLYPGKEYILRNILLTEYEGKLQIKMDKESLIKTDERKYIKELVNPGDRYNIRVKVESIKHDINKALGQEGVLNDETGNINFVFFAESGRRYFHLHKGYLLRNVKLVDNKGRLQVQIDKETQIKSSDQAILKQELHRLEKEKQEVAKHRLELGIKAKDIELEKQNIEQHREDTIKSIEFLENKKAEVRQEKFLAIFGYMLFVAIIIASGLYVYDFTIKKIIPKVNDIIEIIFKQENIPYKVVEDDKKHDIVTLRSLDGYKEELKFTRPMNLKKPSRAVKENLKKHAAGKKAKIYSYDLEKSKKPLAYIKPKRKRPTKKVQTKPREVAVAEIKKPEVQKYTPYIKGGPLEDVVHVNSAKERTVLMTLPGIGPHRVKGLIQGRPYYSVQDVMNAKIGIGSYWAEKWREGIELGLIVFN